MYVDIVFDINYNVIEKEQPISGYALGFYEVITTSQFSRQEVVIFCFLWLSQGVVLQQLIGLSILMKVFQNRSCTPPPSKQISLKEISI